MTEKTSEMDGTVLPAAGAFAHVMTEFLQNLVTCFPENKGPGSALSMLQLVGESAHPAMADAWYKFSRPIVSAIRERKTDAVVQAFEHSEYQMMRQLNAGAIMADSVDDETKASVWKYLESLTSLSELAHVGKPVAPASVAGPKPEFPLTPAAATPAAAAAATPAVAAPAAPAAQPPRPADLLKGITTAIPEIFKSLNDVLKNDENGPLSSLIKQMVNPNQLQSGFAGNLAANMQSEPDTAVMEQVSAGTGLTAAEISAKLKRLELYEKRRQGKKKH
jgi:hypothetical protein